MIFFEMQINLKIVGREAVVAETGIVVLGRRIEQRG